MQSLASGLSMDAPEESSYARFKRVANMDNSQVQNSVYSRQVAKSSSKFTTIIPVLGAIIFGIFYMCPVFPENPVAQSCLAVLVGSAYCWGTEFIPSYCTAYVVAGCAVWLRLGIDKATQTRMKAVTLASTIASRFMDPIIFVFLGSLTMSAALTKLQITDRVSAWMLNHISPKPRVVLIAIMALNFCIAAFLSNVASTTLVLTFSLPIIRGLDPDDPYIRALLFGLAWSGNAGGMATTISSPQNILAIKYINDSGPTPISFVQWMGFALPTAIVLLLAFWGYLALRFKPRQPEIKIQTDTTNFDPWTWKHTFACAITVITIILWALQSTLEEVTGHVGITSLIPVILFFSTGILNSEDFGALRWSTLVLMGGGLALGEAMSLSGLLDIFADLIASKLQSLNVWVVIVIVMAIEAILTSVINHTSAAAILFPVLSVIGEKLNSSTKMLTTSAMMISGAQLFHISSFPNALVSGVQRHSRVDPTRLNAESFLTGKDFFLVGWPTVIVGLLIIASVGYGLVTAMGFK